MKLTTLWLIVLAIAYTLTPGASAQTATAAPSESVIYSFCPGGGWCSGGSAPESLVVDSAGDLYGVTYYGGTGVGGTAFKIASSGDESRLYSFSQQPPNGWEPVGQMILDQQGNLYGVTSFGGTNSNHFFRGDGTVFKLSPDGTETTLYNFGAYNNDGAQPAAGLVMDASGNLYGTTFWGGPYLYGTVFRLSPDGVETILHNFANNSSDGGNPAASLIMDSSGNLYGTTEIGGPGGGGTVFEITADGSYSILHSFVGAQGDGVAPQSALTLDSAGDLYGTTRSGGSVKSFYSGTVFKLSRGSNGSWTESVLYNFGLVPGSCTNPTTNVLLDAKGNLYGMAAYGGPSGGGCAFELSASGKLTLLHAFGQGDDASFPSGNIVFYRGNLYGAAGGGAYAEGSVYKITP